MKRQILVQKVSTHREMINSKMSGIVDNFTTHLQNQLFEIANMSFSLALLST